MSEPTTEAGRRLLDTVRHSIYDAEIRAAILAIESEARATAPAAVERLAEAMFNVNAEYRANYGATDSQYAVLVAAEYAALAASGETEQDRS